MTEQQSQNYLAHLNLTQIELSFKGLKQLQRAHMERVPFENFSVYLGRPVSLHIDQLFDKVVQQGRGGYCFELNVLFAELLSTLGWSPKPVLARVWLRNPEQMPGRNHLAHLVELNGKTYLTDVGFGGQATRVPLDIHYTEPVQDGEGQVRVIPHGKGQFMVQRKGEDDWLNQYSFETVDISFKDIEMANHFMATHPSTHFYKDRFAGRFTTKGRNGLYNNQFTRREGLKTVEERTIPFGEEWLQVLANDFGIQLDLTATEKKKLFADT